MAKLQNQVGDRESEAAALRKEIGKLKVRYHIRIASRLL